MCIKVKVKSSRIINVAAFDIMLNQTVKLLLGELSVQINEGCRANKWEKRMSTPWDSVFVLPSFWSNYEKEFKTGPGTFPASKAQFIHIMLARRPAQGKGLLIGPHYSSHAVLRVISVQLFHYHVTDTVSQRECFDLTSEWFPQAIAHFCRKTHL